MCSSCGSKFSKTVTRERTVQPIGDCSYTYELMAIWKTKLECVKNKNLFDELNIKKYKINFAIGTVDSALYNDPCLFRKQLDEINGIILAIINLGKC